MISNCEYDVLLECSLAVGGDDDNDDNDDDGGVDLFHIMVFDDTMVSRSSLDG